jgi:hypothetical protein
VVADSSKVPVSDWHRHILDERLAEYHAAPDERENRDRKFAINQCENLAERKCTVRPAAQADIREAALWYDAQRPGLGSEFTLRHRSPNSSAFTEGVLKRISDENGCL